MRILFCPQIQASRELGGSKVAVELAEEMTSLGWHCEIKSVPEIAEDEARRAGRSLGKCESMRRFLSVQAGRYDVVDYDLAHLPFSREEFAATTLMVGRSVLLNLHVASIEFPQWSGWRQRIRRLFGRPRQARWLRTVLRDTTVTARHADIVNVPNRHDRLALVAAGIAAERVVEIPYGLDRSRRPRFEAIERRPPFEQRLVFVGTFDFRKGCVDLTTFWEMLCRRMPQVRLRLLGTAGLYQTEAEVRQWFSPAANQRLEVVPRYPADRLPEYLADCTVGLFPSYLEGFGIGILEMLAAGIPVYAYDAPGPASILGEESLLPAGDVNALVERISSLLTNETRLETAGTAARERSRAFAWNRVAEETDRIYRARLDARRRPRRGASPGAAD